VQDALSPRPVRDRSLTELLATPGTFVAAGAHDALTARMVTEAGYDVVWASSFAISLATYCMPDADLLTLTETAQSVQALAGAAGVPILADCSAGFGNAINVLRVVRELERAGASGICIEDNVFPKRSSLYGGWERTLVPADEMAQKVRAARSARTDDGFAVVARVESLIAGEGVDAALERGRTYAAAGADAILVHSKRWDPLAEVAARWNAEAPLVVVPTLFPEVPFGRLRDAGFRLVIYPNQTVRAAIVAIRNVLDRILRTGDTGGGGVPLATLDETYELVDLDALRQAEAELLAPAEAVAAS
jgi:phosphoenolpyruvate phosphomutase